MPKKHILAVAVLLAALMIGICGCAGRRYSLAALKEGGLGYMEQKYGEEFTYIEACYSGSNFSIRITGIKVSCESLPDKEIYVAIMQEENLKYRDNYMDYYFAPQTEDYIVGIAKNYFDDIDFSLRISQSQATGAMDLTTTFEKYISSEYFYVDGKMEIGASDEKTIRKFADDLLGRGFHFSLTIDIPSLYEKYDATYYRYNDEFSFDRRDYAKKINKYEIELVFWTFHALIDPSGPLPYTEDFEGGTFDYVWDIAPCYKWKLIDDGGDKRLMCYDLKQDGRIYENPVFSLVIGDKTWESYVFSFDCKIPDESFATFSPFVDTNTDYSMPDFADNRDIWGLRLDYEGVLLYQTDSGHGTHYIGEGSDARDEAGSAKTKPIDGFVAGQWNHIELFPVGLEVQMKVNGANIGKVAEIHEGISGRVAIGGGVGCMFDNLSVEEIDS